MDDNLEPSTETILRKDIQDAEDVESSGDEDGGPDWTKLPKGLYASIDRPIIPKRGEKDHEPAEGGETRRQAFVLERARDAMFTALRATRTTANKNLSYAVWYPKLARAHVTVSRGIHFVSMGHSVARGYGEDKARKRIELLPEETIYLVERGALFCWKYQEHLDQKIHVQCDSEDALLGAPMSVQQTFAEMIGREDLTLEKYQVYAYLKRLGYVVTRARPPSPAYPAPPPYSLMALGKEHLPDLNGSIMQRFRKAISLTLGMFLDVFARNVALDWWQPLRPQLTYHSLLKSLRLIPAGHNIPLFCHNPNQDKAENEKSAISQSYEIFYNLYKPSTPFRKTAPPQPDFSVVVIDARTTPMPTLRELRALFDVLPELPPPMPRKRNILNTQTAPKQDNKKDPPPSVDRLPLFSSVLRRIFLKMFAPSRVVEVPTPAPRPNPFVALKQGKKNIVIAVVDAGTVGFFRLGMGAFEEWPML
ncbi:hypothetical protein PUNSTDRAFT_118619 [Punctularia strigosozonata HHB-11173 SS5]|uniref:uncharacterized protein n=1 Tax=Punctularia strigosozonata (strain HHB-11173) TaxID=741275 RepID=UPI00044165DD|nr:uncharacterized protein PUNSTDRAFT_118619 [Punctularia strigosozonata HHB-11173 SS5]EIN12995.1 hypothetical protein PUNSTDRAFT_118619 [Punctularia strigosozonata HHB-11173 SS5]